MWSTFQPKIRQLRAVWMTAPTIAVIMLICNFLGICQILEWAVFDQFLRLRPSEGINSRITIITIDEDDLTHLQQWPLSDGVVAQTIANIKAQKPRVIGLDLYRNLTVEPGHQELVKIFQSTPNLIGIEKVAGRSVPPSLILKQKGQVALADLVLDADGKVRRALLSIRRQEGKTQLGLGTDLALNYLAKQGITLKQEPSVNQQPAPLRLGKASFLPWQPNDGGYLRADNGGYQILLNYWGRKESFQTISIQKVYANDFPPELIKDRIVLIGSIAESLNDSFYTPYSNVLSYFPSRMPGVVVHANIASQIVGAALDGRLLFRVFPDPVEWLWIMVWSFVGAYLSWQLLKHQPRQQEMWGLAAWLVGSLTLSGGVLLGISYLLFLAGWWLPVVPSLLALSLSSLCLPGYKNFEWQRLASLDALTRIANRRHFDEVLVQQWLQHQHKNKPLSLIICDVDHFKLYNDTYGHPAGDQCLRQVAQALIQATRAEDLVARYGGEEFAIILTNTPPEEVNRVANRLCAQVKSLQILHSASLTNPCVTLSCGWTAITPQEQLQPGNLVDQADAALYQAKQQGRDRVVSFLTISP